MKLLLTIACLAIPALAQEAGQPAATTPAAPAKLISSDIPAADLSFYSKALENGARQLMLAEIARAKATAPQVRALAEMLASNQPAVNERVILAAMKRGLPGIPGESPARKDAQARLNKLAGEKFDQAVLAEMTTTAAIAQTLFEAAEQTADADLRNTIAASLPAVREHHVLAQTLSAAPAPVAARQLPKPAFRIRPAR